MLKDLQNVKNNVIISCAATIPVPKVFHSYPPPKGLAY